MGRLPPLLALGLVPSLLAQPRLSVSPASISFGTHAISAGATEPQAVTVTNTGTLPVRRLDLRVEGRHASEFAVIPSALAGPLAPGESLEVTVAFDPLWPGPRQAAVAITGDAPRVVIDLFGAGLAGHTATLAHPISREPPVVSDAPPVVDLFFPQGQTAPVRITVTGEVLNPVSDRLFGQLAERHRADHFELGIEGAFSAHAGDWRPGFTDLVEALAPTVIRFPGGVSAERTDWHWAVDNVPGRLSATDFGRRGRGRLAQEETPGIFTTYRVGTDEIAGLCARTGAEPWFVVNMAGYRDHPALGASVAADWVEYCNAPHDGSNPRGGIDWAAIRAANGHTEPHGVRLWEIGNEVWSWPAHMEPGRYREIVPLYVEAMLEVDPTIEFIGLGQRGPWAEVSLDAFGDRLRYVTRNCYALWQIRQSVTEQDLWRAVLTGPPQDFLDEIAETRRAIEARGRAGDVRLAVNEWNVNVSLEFAPSRPRVTHYLTMIGAAAILHEFIRRGDEIGLAAMSSLAGMRWQINTIRFPTDLEGPPRPDATHAMMALYRAQHGGERVGVALDDCPAFDVAQPVGNIPVRLAQPLLNVVATRSAEAVFVHILNGAPRETVECTLAAAEAGADARGPVEIHQIAGGDPLWVDPHPEEFAVRVTPVEADQGVVALALPPGSVTVVRWQR